MTSNTAKSGFSSWRNRIHDACVDYALPIGVFVALTGLLWTGAHSYYPRLLLIFITLPTLVLMIARPSILGHLLQSRIVLCYLVFSAWVLLSLFWAKSDDDIDSLIKRPLLVLLLFCAFIELARHNADRLEQSVRLAALLAVGMALYTVGRFLVEGTEIRLSGYGAISNPLMVSHVYGFFIALWLGRLFVDKNTALLLPVVAVIVCGSLLLLTGSRTPLVATAATTLWLALMSANRRAFVIITALALMSASVLMLWPEVFMQRGLSYRPQIWANALQQIGDSPWIGHGYGTPMWIQLNEIPYPFREPHNLTLSVLFDLGVIGGVLWAGIYGFALASAWQQRKDPRVLTCSAVVIYGLVSGMTEGSSFLSRPKEHWFIVWIPLALLAAALFYRRGFKDGREDAKQLHEMA